MKKSRFTQKNGASILLSLSLMFVSSFGIYGCSSDSGSETSSKIKEAVDAVLNAADHRAGISVAVYKADDSMWTYAAGCAECDPKATVKMTTSTPTFAYSITKTFVSALVLKQIENGYYNLTDNVQTLLSGQSYYSSLNTSRINESATVEELLTHTSGMPNYADNLSALIPQCNPTASWNPEDILLNIVDHDYVSDNVGTYEYSNTNYILLGLIAETEATAHGSTALTLNTLLANAFFTPLGINLKLAPQDAYPTDIAHPNDDAYIFGLGLPVGSYMDFANGIKILNPAYDIYLGIGRGTWAAGGIIGTAEDLAIWGWELYNDEGSAITPVVRTSLKNSAIVDGQYGYGVTYKDFSYTDGTVGGTYGHGGSAPGYKTLLIYEKNKGISVAIITNINNTYDGKGLINQDALAEELFNAYQGD